MNLLTPPDRQALAELNINTADQLTDRVLRDPQFPDQFGPAAARIRATVIDVVQQRSRNFLVRSRSITRGELRKYRFDALLLLLLILVAIALWRDRHAPNPVLASKNGVLPFHPIVPSDLRLSCDSNNPPEQSILDNFVGRYSFEYLEPCASIIPKKLSSGQRLTIELKSRAILRLKVQPTSVFAGMHPPFKAILMVAPRERGTTTLLLNDLFVLDLQKETDGMSAIVAILSVDEPTVASFVSRCDLFLVARLP